MFLIVFRRDRCVAESTSRIVETSEAPPVAETASWVRGSDAKPAQISGLPLI